MPKKKKPSRKKETTSCEQENNFSFGNLFSHDDQTLRSGNQSNTQPEREEKFINSPTS